MDSTPQHPPLPTSVPGEAKLWAVRKVGQNYPDFSNRPEIFRDLVEQQVKPGFELVEIIVRVPVDCDVPKRPKPKTSNKRRGRGAEKETAGWLKVIAKAGREGRKARR